MAVEHLTTAAIAAANANSSKQARQGEPLLVFTGVAEVSDDASIGSTYRLVRVPSNLRITEITLACDAVTAAAADVGVYDISANGGAVVDADEFASNQSIATASGGISILVEAAATDIDKLGKPLWERMGLTADSGKAYDIALTLTSAATDPGTVALTVRGYTA